MRNIKKTIKVREVEVTFYDRTLKSERTEKFTVSEVEEFPNIPENCVWIEQKEVPGSEKELVYTMTPEDFVKHATASEKK